jgi:hypothetical protein
MKTLQVNGKALGYVVVAMARLLGEERVIVSQRGCWFEEL